MIRENLLPLEYIFIIHSSVIQQLLANFVSLILYNIVYCWYALHKKLLIDKLIVKNLKFIYTEICIRLV